MIEKSIAVVIPTYNRADSLRLTLGSLQSQTLDKSAFEVIVVDDGGYDNSRSVVRKFSRTLNISYHWQVDKGFRAGKARSVGTVMCDAKYVVYIDSGVLLGSRCLHEHLKLHGTSSEPVVVIGYVYGFEADYSAVRAITSEANLDDVDSTISMLRDAGAADIRQKQYDELGDEIERWPAPFDIFWTCHVSAEREELLRAGLFDESFNTWGGEDVDLGVRLHLNGNRFVLGKQACSLHLPEEFDVEERKRLSSLAGRRIHRKYGLNTTSFYGLQSSEQKYSLNAAILRARGSGRESSERGDA